MLPAAPGPAAAAQQPSACAGRGPQHANGLLVVDRERHGRFTPGEPLLTVRPDGSGVRRLSSPGRRQTDGALHAVAASPDGRWVTFVRRSGERDTVKLVSLATRKVRTLPGAVAPLTFAPAPWSPDGRWIMIAQRFPFATWLVRQDGTGGHLLDTGNTSLTPRAFSPNGRCIIGIFVANPNGVGQLGVVPASGGAPTTLPNPPGDFRRTEAFRWTPDGRQIIFTGLVGSQAGIYRMAPDGTGLRRLVRLRSAADTPVFSPDGRLMAYNDRRGTMVRPVAGGRAHRLLKGLWVKAWASRPR